MGNYGLNLTHDFTDKIQYSLDLYLTHFQNQIVADFDRSPQQFVLYKSQGQVIFKKYPDPGWHKPGGRSWYQTGIPVQRCKTTYSGNTLPNPPISPPQGLANAGYTHKSGWRFDYTISWQSSKRIPGYRKQPRSLSFTCQVRCLLVEQCSGNKGLWSKIWSIFWGEISLAIANRIRLSVREIRYGNYFDASLGLGTRFGAMWYGGFRYRLIDEK